MKPLLRWGAVVLALALLMTIVASGDASLPASAAAAQATQDTAAEATATSPAQGILSATDTPGPTEATPTEEPPLVFTKAPSPDAATVGIIMGNDTPVRLDTVVAGGPAEKAGLKSGDVVVALDGTPVEDSTAVVQAILAKKAGDTVTFTVERNGEKQDYPVTLVTRREVYCPLPAPTATAGDVLVKDPLGSANSWILSASLSSPGVKVNAENGKLTFQPTDPGTLWQGIATLKSDKLTNYVLSVDITQSNQAAAGLLFNFVPSRSAYVLQLQPNGSWAMRAVFSDGSSSSSLSFGEPDLKAVDETDPSATVTNTVGVVLQDNNFYLSFNGKFACGTPLTQFSDPPLPAAQLGILVLVDKDPTGKLGVSFSNLTVSAIKP
jgi:membrane-associated protease RseP (regulator of RpoE activity)